MNGTGKEESKKILLMGKAGVGKTSMRSIIFANCAPKDTFVLGYTHEVSENRLRFMGNLTFNLLDCGGQEEFIKQYFESKKETIFSSVEVLIFVIEADPKTTDPNEDLGYFENCIKALTDYSPSAKIFVLIHKMDLIQEQKREDVFNKRRNQLQAKAGDKFTVTAFPTSIWEATLYKAWTNIVTSMTANLPKLQKSLENFANACGAEEIILFEKSTFLLTCSYTSKEIKDEERFEKISHIIKKFKLSCMTSNARFQSMVIQTKNFTTYLDEFTKSTYIMFILSDKTVNMELLKLNTALCRETFENRINGSEKS